MATKRAGSIVINLSAGSAQFTRDMEKASNSVRNFGRAGVSEARATSSAMRALEGNFLSNTRAADQFLEKVLHLGPAMRVAFPVIGAVAFAGALIEAGKKAEEFFEKMRTAPDRMTNAFREVTAPLRQAADELSVANAKLQNDIDKLQGKRENTLALALAEARVAADKLADSLDNDLQKISDVMKKNEVGFLSGLFTGRQPTSGNTDEQEQFGRNMALINERGNASVRAATVADLNANDQKQTQTRAAQAAWNKAVADALDAEIKKQERLLELAQLQQKIHEGTASAAEREKAYDLRYPGERQPGQVIAINRGAPNQTLSVIDQQKRLEDLNYARDIQNATVANEALQRKDTALHGAADNAKVDRPFEDRMKQMSAAIDGIKAKMASIGQGEASEVLAKSFADAQKTIEEVNKALEEHHTKLTQNQEDQIRNKAYATASADAELAWKTKLEATTAAIADRIRSQQMLTAAIGAGYEATKRASVETSVMGAVGGKNYGDKDWMAAHQSDVSSMRSQFGQQYDAQHADETGKAVHSLEQQIDLEKALAKAQMAGAEAVRFATLMHNLKTIAQDNDAESARRLIAAEVLKYKAERENASEAALAKINAEAAATERLTAAVWQGAEATRQAGLANKYDEMKRTGSSPEVIEATKVQDAAAHQEQLSAEAAKLATSYQDTLTRISQLTEKLQQAKATQGDTLGIEVALKDLENERLKTMSEMLLQTGRAQDAVRAFFLDMQQQGKQAADALYEGLHSALDKVSSELANVLTGQKTSWAKMFQSLGHDIETNAIKSGLQTGLGKLAKPGPTGQQTTLGRIAGGVLGTGVGKPDGSTAANALWVRMADAQGSPIQNNGAPGTLPGVSRKGNVTFGNGGLLGTGGVPTASDQSDSGGGDAEVKQYDEYGFRLRPQAPTTPVFLPPTPAQDIGPAGSGQIGDTVSTGDTLAGIGGDPATASGAADSPFMSLPSSLGGFASKALSFGNQKKITPKMPGWLKWLKLGIDGTLAFATQDPQFLKSALGDLNSDIAGGGDGTNVSSNISYDMSDDGDDDGGDDSDFGGGLATGGPVKTGKHYLVGERGPELFRSGTAGHIVDHETTKRLARAGMLPAGVKVPGVSTSSPGSRATAAPKRIQARADGGDVSAGDSYITGERGPELFTSGAFSSEQGSRRTPGNGGNAYYSIDARGTDPVLTEQRVKAALVAVHGSAVSTSIQGVDERQKRTPQRA